MKNIYSYIRLLLILLASIVWPQSSGDRLLVNGVVLDTQTGVPIADAIITVTSISASSQRSTTQLQTDAAGLFRLAVPIGTYQLTASREGYISHADNSPRSSKIQVDVKSAGGRRNVKVYLSKAGTITGKVTNNQSDPIHQAIVHAVRVDCQNGRRRVVNAKEALTNDRGEYRLTNLSPGEYRIFAEYRQTSSIANLFAATTGSTLSTEYDVVYYPKEKSVENATLLTIRGGTELSNISMSLPQVPSASIVIHVDGPPSAINGGVTIFSDDPGEECRRVLTMGPFQNGVAHLTGLPLGPIAVLVHSQVENDTLFGFTHLVASSGSNEARLTLVPKLRIRAVVKTETTGPRLPEGSRLVLKPRCFDGMLNSIAAKTSSDGSLVFDGVLPIEYKIDLAAGDDRLIRGYLGDLDVSERFHIYRTSSEVLKIDIANVVGKITGVVSDKSGLPGIASRVNLYKAKGLDKILHFINQVTADERGVFQFEGIESGAYVLRACKAQRSCGTTEQISISEEKLFDIKPGVNLTVELLLDDCELKHQ